MAILPGSAEWMADVEKGIEEDMQVMSKTYDARKPFEEAKRKEDAAHRELRLWKSAYLSALAVGPVLFRSLTTCQEYADAATDYAYRVADNFVADINEKRDQLLKK